MTFFDKTEKFDYVIIGSGLDASQKSFELSKENKRILQIEESSHYGGHLEASIRFQEYLKKFTDDDENNTFALDKRIEESLANIIVDINPDVIGTAFPLATWLLDNQLTENLDFTPIKRFGIIYNSSQAIEMPLCKEDIMICDKFSLTQKLFINRLLKSMMSSDSNKNDSETRLRTVVTDDLIFSLIAYGVCGAFDSNEAEDLSMSKVRRHCAMLKSSFHSSYVLLYPQWGSSSIIQSISRAAAIKGAINILGQNQIKLETCPDGSGIISGVFENQVWDCAFENVHDFRDLSAKFTEMRAFIVLDSAYGGIFGENCCAYWTMSPTDLFPLAIKIIQLDHFSHCCNENQIIIYCKSKGRDDIALDEFANQILALISNSRIIFKHFHILNAIGNKEKVAN